MAKRLLGVIVVVVLAGCSGSGRAAPTPTTGPQRTGVVPNVISLRACDALPILVKAGAVPEATPASQLTWIVEAQRPKAGDPVERGTSEVLNLVADPMPNAPPLSQSCKRAVAASHTSQTPSVRGVQHAVAGASCGLTISWHSPRYSDGYARFAMRITSDDPGNLVAEIRELDNGHSFIWTGRTDQTGSFKLNDAIGPNLVGRSEVLVGIRGHQRAQCSRLTTLPS